MVKMRRKGKKHSSVVTRWHSSLQSTITLQNYNLRLTFFTRRNIQRADGLASAFLTSRPMLRDSPSESSPKSNVNMVKTNLPRNGLTNEGDFSIRGGVVILKINTNGACDIIYLNGISSPRPVRSKDQDWQKSR